MQWAIDLSKGSLVKVDQVKAINQQGRGTTGWTSDGTAVAAITRRVLVGFAVIAIASSGAVAPSGAAAEREGMVTAGEEIQR